MIATASATVPSRREKQRAAAAKALRRWRNDPVRFAYDVLRINDAPLKCWSRQAEMLQAVAAHSSVSVRSGHKVSKSTTASILALWWYCTRRRARVIITSASYFQVEEIIWAEIRSLYKGAAVDLGGELHETPSGGLQHSDGRQIVGLSVKEPERMAGFSGPNNLYIVDEASGVEDSIFETIEGNRAGGAKLFIISNPTQVSGIFYRSHHEDAGLWHPIHISSEEVANEVAPGTGLATKQWVEEKRKLWGPDFENDARYLVRVKGEFPKQGSDTWIGLALVDQAQKATVAGIGELSIGVDVARYGEDRSAIAPARGKRVFPVTVLQGFHTVAVKNKVLEVIKQHRVGTEKVTVRIDSSNMGAGVADQLREVASQSEDHNLRIIDCMASSHSTEPEYSRLRDQVWGGLRDFLVEGGALPPGSDVKADIVAPKYGFDANNRIKLESKYDMKKRIKRSTDIADAIALAVFQAKTSEWNPIVVSLSDRDDDDE